MYKPLNSKIMSYSDSLSIPIWQMTGEQFVELLSAVIRPRYEYPGQFGLKDLTQDEKYAYGIKGISEIFGCSVPTAQRIKSSGIIDAAITQLDRTIVVDRQKALELVQNKKKGGRR
jgi:hypothetical protein